MNRIEIANCHLRKDDEVKDHTLPSDRILQNLFRSAKFKNVKIEESSGFFIAYGESL